MKLLYHKQQNGSALIISLIFMLVILVLVGSLFEFVTQNVKATRRAVAGEQALALAEAGVDKAVSELNATAGAYSGETGTALGTGVFDASVATLSATLKEITVTGYAPNKTNPQASRKVKVRVGINTTVVNFKYGLQVGDGGLHMKDNSQVNGNVYVNGKIDGEVGKKNTVITGDAFSARSTGQIKDMIVNGNASAHSFNNVTVSGDAKGYSLDKGNVTGNVFANAISNCAITGNASYTTKSSCTVGGTNTTPYPGEPDPAPESFPISDDQINDWKNSAVSGGTITGDYDVNSSVTLGPKKITGHLHLKNNATLTLTGPIWAVKDIDIDKGSVVALASSYGNNSEVIISDDSIDVSKDVDFQRAGSASYILTISTDPGGDAIKISKNGDALVVYAPSGGVHIEKDAIVREVTGWKVNMEKDTQINYETGLANLQFSSGPGGSWTPVRGTWREIK